MTLLRKGQLPVFLVNLAAIIFFSLIFIQRRNYEFILYIFVIIFFLCVIVLTNDKVRYPNGVLWGLTLWATMHMAGGGLFIGGKKLYELMILGIVGSPYLILKYDQAVHFIGFWVATLVIYHVLVPSVKDRKSGKLSIMLVVVMAGLGLGALNEIIEFLATVLVPSTGVGGYVNTALDLVFDFLGAIGAGIFLSLKGKSRPAKPL